MSSQCILSFIYYVYTFLTCLRGKLSKYLLNNQRYFINIWAELLKAWLALTIG